MTTRQYQIRGTKLDQSELPKLTAVKLTPSLLVTPGRARDGVTSEHSVASDDVVRVVLENGFVLWIRADDLISDYGTPLMTRDGTASFEFSHLVKPRNRPVARDERGLASVAIKTLEFFGVDLAQKSAAALCKTFEDSLLQGRTPGLHRSSLDDAYSLSALAAGSEIPADAGPLLLFIHGTASNGEGSFGALWAAENASGRQLRGALKKDYGERCYAFEHRTLTESPIENALALAKSLPKGARLHLVSHSRGGMVGELLCLAQCVALDKLDDAACEHIFKAEPIALAQQLGLSPLDADEVKAREQAYAADRKRLTKLLTELRAKQFSIERFVRVACPARGTTLASGRLDRWLSILSFLSGEGFANLVVEFLLAVVKERTDPRTLPGLEAMMPGSPVTRLLNHPDLTTTADLTVISGDIEGESIWQKLKWIAVDWFYSAEHDLVVNTGSMSGGLPRPPNLARFQKDQGSGVNHFRYFTNEKSIGWLRAALLGADPAKSGFQPLAHAQKEAPRWRGALARSRAATDARPLAVVLPGTMGSELKADGDRVWLSYRALAFGGLHRLRFGLQEVTPFDLLDDFYGPLLEYLARTHRVEIFPYDWRLSVREAAVRLTARLEELLPVAERQKQPVHLVAHSMGGLVVRSMIAGNDRGRAVWQRIVNLPNSRFLMLGTPNYGSYEAVRWLTGFNPTQAKLALLDLTHDTNEIIDIVRNFPGLLELLPFGQGDADFTRQDLWISIKQATQAGWAPAEAGLLRDLTRTWNLLRTQTLDSRYVRYVAGCQPATVIGYQFADDPRSARRKRLEFLATRQGDGTVPWASGKLEGIDVWYVENTAHDALCAQNRAFPGYLDLLMTGQTTRLPKTPPAVQRGATTDSETFVLPESPPLDSIPTEAEISRFGFAGNLPVDLDTDRPSAPILRVRIRHGDLAYAAHPVMVGHYLGDTIVSAEKALDDRLDGALSERLDLGIYPGPLNSHALFFNDRANAKPTGAIVVGLGQVGELTPGLLEVTVRRALLDYALQVSRWPDERFGKPGAPRKASISCLLIGSGAGMLPVRDSIEAILRAAHAANVRLVGAELDAAVTIDEIEFVDLFEDVCISAAEVLAQVLKDGELAGVVEWRAQSIEPGEAGQRRVRFDEEQEWWHRIEIVEDEDSGRLRFIASTDRARAEETLATGQLALAEKFIERASMSAVSNADAAKTLFEMLLPVRLKEQALRQTDLVLLVDPRSARYPWELLENRWSENGLPLAVNAGMIRQLKTPSFRPNPAHASDHKVLVIGNPDLSGWPSFSDLPGAREEGWKVAALLNETRYDVTECVDEKAEVIVEKLHFKQWRILHFAGHGVYDFPIAAGRTVRGEIKEQRISGMVIGPNTFLTPGDIEQMRWVPELVFINCCHLGRAGGEIPGDRGLLASNLAIQFIRMGVKAVVAAGWAVDDGAAVAFAEVFYRLLLNGMTFGEAVRAAREEVWTRFKGVNTWGAYQCYGDPSFRLLRSDGTNVRQPKKSYTSPAELVADLDNWCSRLNVENNPDDCRSGGPLDAVNLMLDRIPQHQREEWLRRADVAAAVGLMYGELRRWTEAVQNLRTALAAKSGQCPLRTVEQLGNFMVRGAVEAYLSARMSGVMAAEAGESPREQIREAIRMLEALLLLGETGERLNLVGGAYKRLAIVESGNNRLAALNQLARNYRRSFELTGKAYPFINWAAAVLCGASAHDLQTITARLPEVRSAVVLANEDNPHFWDSVALADLDVLQTALDCGLPPKPAGDGGAAKGPADAVLLIENVRIEAIIETYRSAIRRGASPKSISSVKEHLEFLIEMASDTAPPFAVQLRRINEEI